jgi:protein-L-isoaspartate(D-aspartate) O-methyltransferase
MATVPSRYDQITHLLRTLHHHGVRDPQVLLAIAAVPRERFVPVELRARAWENRALPIGDGQTISQPLVVGLMTQALALTGAEHVLEVGTGSGYHAAILARLARSVVTVEINPVLAIAARQRLAQLGYQNVTVEVADGSQGWPAAAPYDRILVTAATPVIPPALLEQLCNTDGARLVLPLGRGQRQELIMLERRQGHLVQTSLGAVAFVPLRVNDGGYVGKD